MMNFLKCLNDRQNYCIVRGRKRLKLMWRNRGCAIEVHNRQGDRVGWCIGSKPRKLISGANEGNAQCIAQHTRYEGKDYIAIYRTKAQCSQDDYKGDYEICSLCCLALLYLSHDDTNHEAGRIYQCA
jgi:hypothetical protein